jgi:hypothetical protein
MDHQGKRRAVCSELRSRLLDLPHDGMGTMRLCDVVRLVEGRERIRVAALRGGESSLIAGPRPGIATNVSISVLPHHAESQVRRGRGGQHAGAFEGDRGVQRGEQGRTATHQYGYHVHPDLVDQAER